MLKCIRKLVLHIAISLDITTNQEMDLTRWSIKLYFLLTDKSRQRNESNKEMSLKNDG